MSRKRKSTIVGVRYAGALTPNTLQRIGARLTTPACTNLIDLVRRGASQQFSLDVGDGMSIEYPATEQAILKVDC